ncbi:MAG: hypothetical protein ACRERD_04765 [Candidatus Binatia bacterium]
MVAPESASPAAGRPGVDMGVLAQWAVQQGWGVCLRLRVHEYVRRAGAPSFEMLPLVLPGGRRFWSHVAFTQKHRLGGLNLAIAGSALLRGELLQLDGLPQRKQVLGPPVPLECPGNLGFTLLAVAVADWSFMFDEDDKVPILAEVRVMAT